MADLTGYKGDQPAFAIELSHDRSILQKPRMHSPREVEVMNKNCSTLLDAGFIQPCQDYKCASTLGVCAHTLWWPLKRIWRGNGLATGEFAT